MPSDPRLTNAPASPREVLFRAIDSVVRADPTVRGIFRTIKSWQGRPDDKAPLALADAPVLRMTPRAANQNWWSSDAQTGTLFVEVEIVVPGTCVDDLDRAYYALERALVPASKAALDALVFRFQGAGAHKAVLRSAQPAFDPTPGVDDALRGTAAFQVEYRIPFLS